LRLLVQIKWQAEFVMIVTGFFLNFFKESIGAAVTDIGGGEYPINIPVYPLNTNLTPRAPTEVAKGE
jgi:hypothetical protein